MTVTKNNSEHDKKTSKYRSILTRAPIIAVVSILLAGAILCAISFVAYSNFAIESYSNQAAGIATGIAGSINYELFYQSVHGGSPDEYWLGLYRLINVIYSRLEETAYIYIVVPCRDDMFAYYASTAIAGGFLVSEPDPGVFGVNTEEVFLHGNIVTTGISDEGGWGALVSGLAPIMDPDGTVIGLVGVDFFAGPIIERAIYSTLRLSVFIMILSVVTGVILSVNNRYAIAQNIKAFERTRESNARAALVLEAMPIAAFLTRRVPSDNGEVIEILECNEAIRTLLGFRSKDETKARLMDSFQLPSEYKSVEDMTKEYAYTAYREGSSNFTTTMKSVKNELIPVNFLLVRVNYNDEPALAIFVNDLRKEKRVEEAEKKAQLLLRALPVACVLFDSKFNILDCNRATLELFLSSKDNETSLYSEGDEEKGFASCDLKCKGCKNYGNSHCRAQNYFVNNYRHIFSEYSLSDKEIDEHISKHCNAALSVNLENELYGLEQGLVTFYGEPIYCEVTIVPVKLSEDLGFACYIKDVSAERLRIVAEEGSKAKTRFLAQVSHEIRTPMNSIMGVAEIEMQKNIHTADTEEAFLRIFNSSKSLLSLINEILDLSKVEAGKMEIMPVSYDTASLIADVSQLNLIYMGSKKINFSLDIDERIPVRLIGDDLRIRQIFNNLLSNAFKYTAEGDITLKIHISETSSDDVINLMTTVTDTGQGMSSGQLGELFNSDYTRFSEEKNRTVEGHGLGLNITHSLVELMGGEIQVESELNKGTTVTVNIPQIVNSKQTLGREVTESLANFDNFGLYAESAPEFEHEPMPYGKVLVVDDVESNLYVAKGFLRPYRLAVETAQNGSEAISLIESGKEYDIVFMDHMLPGMDGVEVTKILRSSGYTHPIVALTANAAGGISQLFLDNGFSDFISKPINPRKLDTCLRTFIFEKQSTEVIEHARAKFPKQKSENGKKDISEQLKNSFMIDAERSIEVLESVLRSVENLDEGLLKLYVIQTHAIKSALANIHKSNLSEKAGILEDAGRTRDIATIQNQTPEFLVELQEVVKLLSLRKKDESVKSVEDYTATGNLLLEISEACEAYDTQKEQELIKTLKKMPLTTETSRVVEQIEKHLLFSDDEEAAELAKQAANDILNKAQEKAK
ncbi:MAG: ATP-binding protein [Oscillospiraceae bacterium]|nr:ATP-binding protein [Oscillospiraceae bacterium]